MNDMNNFGMSGKWINKFTGEIINVRDMIMDGDQMIVISDKGTINMKEFSDKYIQSSDEIYDINGNVISNAPTDFSEILVQENKQGNVKLFNDNVINSTNVTDNITKPKNEHHTYITIGNIDTIDNTNYKLIDKLFNKTQFNPTINITIESYNFPVEQLKMLIDIYDISEQEISDYIRNNYINIENINESITAFIKKELY